MCGKNFEGKVLSSPSDDDIDETLPKDWKPVKKSKKKRRSRKRIESKFCKTCGQDILEMEKRDIFMYKDAYHQLRAKGYCKDHETTYGDHKCKPHWCGDCDYLVNYQIEVQVRK
tara:strand:- start:64 stop:405 length:342 start_codon:yes stop_codon:yes gene_type:complete